MSKNLSRLDELIEQVAEKEKRNGINIGFKMASQKLLYFAGEKFKIGKDEEAEDLRGWANVIADMAYKEEDNNAWDDLNSYLEEKEQ